MRKFPIVSLSSVEDMESSVLPTRGIKRGKRELGKIMFFHPLIQNSPKALLAFLLPFSAMYDASHAKPVSFMGCLVAHSSSLALALRW